MSHLVISKKNEVYLHIDAEVHIYYELADQFTFDVPGASFSPAYKKKFWDGKIRYYDATLKFLEEIIKNISNRTFQIKNAIEWNRFQAGM